MTERKRIFPALLACALLLSLATPAFAVDGCIEINEAKIQASGGYPFTVSSSGCYRLTGNLNPPASKDCIRIQAQDVTLDLNGFTITGVGFDAGSADGIVGVDNLSVFNGTVKGFNNGIYVNGYNLRVEKVRLISNVWGLGVAFGSAMVVGNMFYLNHQFAMFLHNAVVGYSNNLFQSNGALTPSAGATSATNLGGNLCDGTACP
jgi:hypothetical protein